jgi:uncharacterized protein YbjT (DUF2867 family)
VPVLVTAAHRPLARRLVGRLLDEGGQVRAVASDDVAALRGRGVHVAHATPDDEGRLEAACTQVHTVIHLAGGLGAPDPAASLREATVAVHAAARAQVQRLVVVTIEGADASADDPLRRAHAAIEDEVAAADLPAVVVRTGLVATEDLVRRVRAAGLAPEWGERRIATVDPAALVELLVAIDRARSSARRGTLTIAADGPADVPLASLIGTAAGDAGASRVGSRLPDPAQRAALLATLDGPWRNADPDVPDAWALLGVSPDGGGTAR